MADTKISALPASTTPLAGTEVLPIVQSSSTKQVSVANLTAGRAVNALSLSLTTALPVASGGTNATTASITSFNNITGYSASGATGTTSTNLVFSTSPSVTTPTFVGNVTLSTGNINVAGILSGFGTTGVNGYVITTQQVAADNSLSRHHKANAGGGTAITTQCTQTTTGITTAKPIASLEDVSFVLVRGSDGAGNEFFDNLMTTNSGTPTVVHSVTTSGSPAARTYTLSSFQLNLAMASGTYSTNCMWFQMTAR